ncbi:carboxypeptidase regulatory-like domain-containing protein [Bacillus albus]|uniref:carboxypeptidase regulatory-like domain-containing protein n=1 Tax=Bacillus cereus group TaxID=86661 RepID=UPI0022E3A883|nr:MULTISPECIES: carboxypeptidase regulatory-like domain-containing protein [Bacillus cereus group]MDA2025967.1 carboxypeptidase regulatory-like domain-containing protein [Bacillus cereus group sp. Bcc03]MDA2215745.1 carboxypeptidase regulatory-like domain-containing protein [Bacillus cereus group sp. Bc228]MDA2225879.1 carboxypeptidase regulatory-like domain-containing protein [Bacillus cereus group sp. Bc227]MDA2260071.1 carboxypeptidase regulatory-like domain-containing protein [Bacillus cer
MRRKIILLFVCIVIIIGAFVVTKYYKKNDQCIAVGKYSRGIIVDQNNEPISNVKIYEDSIESKERSISNAEGKFEITHGVCGEIVLQLVTPDGEIYTRKYDSKHIPKVIKLNYKNEDK